MHKISDLTHEEIDNLNISVHIKEIKLFVKNFHTKRTPGSDGITRKSFQTFTGKSNNNLTQILSQSRRGNIS